MRQPGLVGKALGLAVGLFLTIAIVAGAYSAFTLSGKLEAEYRSKGVAIAESIGTSSEDLFLNRDASTIQAMLDQFKRIAGVSYVFVVDASGDIVAHTFVPVIPAEVLAGLSPEPDTIAIHYEEFKGLGRFMDVSCPVLGGLAGHVHVGMDLGLIQSEIRLATLRLALILAGVLALCVGLVYAVARRVSKPLRQLELYAKRLADQDFDAPLEVAALDEIGLLATTMREMAQELGRRRAVQEANARTELEAALDAADEALLVVSTDGRIRSANDRTWDLFSLEPTAIMGAGVRTLWPRATAIFEEPEILKDLIRECEAQPERSHWTDLSQRWPERRDLRVVVSPVMPRPGEVAGWLVAFRDQTQERQVERMKDEFISLVSHELRTPLTSIRGSLGLIDAGLFGGLNPEGQRATRIAVRNTDRLIRLLNDILDLERLETGRIPLERSICDLGRLLEDATDAMQPMADSAGVELILAPLSADIHADPDRLVQVFTNLLSNAIKFSPPGGHIWIGAEISGEEVRAWVRDEGRGVPGEKLEHIFGRFQQVDASDSRDKGGTGLGLAICRSIVSLHSGRIWVESELGQGSTFSVALPMRSQVPAAG